jgi:catechol 2,3-dioxygenase-like lactoylglutathione lyase family enzyme
MAIHNVDVGLVSRSDALVGFYVDVLGAERLEPRQFPFATVHRLACGPVTLKVMIPADPPADDPRGGSFWDRSGIRYVTLWVDDLDDLVARWTGAGGTVTTAPMELRPGVRVALLADPDANAVEVMQAAG